MPLKTLDIDHESGRAPYQSDLALIRPDHYVAWRGDPFSKGKRSAVENQSIAQFSA